MLVVNRTYRSSRTELRDSSRWIQFPDTYRSQKQPMSQWWQINCPKTQAKALIAQHHPSYMLLRWILKEIIFLICHNWAKIDEQCTIAYLKDPIRRNVDEKYGTTVLVFRSSSWSNVLDANRATRICLNMPLSSAYPTTRKNSSSHSPPLQQVYRLTIKFKCSNSR